MWKDKESVSHYRRRGALTALLINKSPISPPSWQKTFKHVLWLQSVVFVCFDFIFLNKHKGSTWLYGELMEELRQKGCWRYLPPSRCFYKCSQSPLISPGSKGGGEGEGDRVHPFTFCSHQQRQTGAEPLNPKRHPHNGWFCCSLVALQDPPQTLARTGSRRARLILSPPVCLLFGTDGQTYRNLRLLPRKARWIGFAYR